MFIFTTVSFPFSGGRNSLFLFKNLNSNFTKLAMTETKILTTSQTKDTQAFWFWYCFKPETDFTGLGHRTTG
jgi:hypothetical protein